MRASFALLALAWPVLASALSPALDAFLSKSEPDWPGASVEMNCTPGVMPGAWLEITDIGTTPFKQYVESPFNQDVSGVPNPLPFPYTLSAADTRAPGFNGSCISKSPTAPADCQGSECNVKITEWNVTWLEFADLLCMQSYPTANLTNFFTQPEPPAGNVTLLITNQCKNYYYTGYFYSVTDPWGHKWALQTSQNPNLTTEADWDAWLATIAWPSSKWQMEKVVLNETQLQTPWSLGDGCYWNILKDNLDNTWHQYTYPEEGPASSQSLLGQIDGCQALGAAYTAKNMVVPDAKAAKAAAPATAPATSTVAKASSSASALGAGATAAAALAAAALLLA